MSGRNKFGLTRNIPTDIKRKVRQNSKFGCVLCRRGFYQYEHIDPPFEECLEHVADAICCLCGSCHDMVTRGQLSKEAVKLAYKNIQSNLLEEVSPPTGPLDFHDGTAELLFGGLCYSPAVQTVLRYHGIDLIKVIPGSNGEPGKIRALFTDNQGRVTLQLEDNAWIGNLENWDIEIVGQKITVRRKHGEIALKIRLDPPGRLVIERLDMRFRQGHILATEKTYAVGRYLAEQFLCWTHVNIEICQSSSVGAAIEFTDSEALELRDMFFQGNGTEMATPDRSMVINSNAGVLVKSLGIAIASLTGSFKISEMGVIGELPLNEMRKAIFNDKKDILEFIATYSCEPKHETPNDSKEILDNPVSTEIETETLNKISLYNFLNQNLTVLEIDTRIAKFTKNNFRLDENDLERNLRDLHCCQIETVVQLEEFLKSYTEVIVKFYYLLDKKWIMYLQEHPESHGNGTSPRGISITYLTLLLAVMNNDSSFINKYYEDADSLTASFEEAKKLDINTIL